MNKERAITEEKRRTRIEGNEIEAERKTKKGFRKGAGYFRIVFVVVFIILSFFFFGCFFNCFGLF